MFKILLLAFTLVMPTYMSAQSAQTFSDENIEAFLRASNLTPEKVGMRWYRECRIQGIGATPTDKIVSKWELASMARARYLVQDAARRNRLEPEREWQAICRAQLHFPDSAPAAALLPIELVQYRLIPDGPVLTMNEGNSLRYHTCQSVPVLGDLVIRKPGCETE